MGKGFFEGDMMLTPKQQSVLDKMYVKDNDDTEAGTKRALIKDTMYLWPKGRVYYDFHKGVGRLIMSGALPNQNITKTSRT